jgi:hypothetical protein
MNELWSITDAQRLGLKGGRAQLAGSNLRLVVIGNSANTIVAHDQIRDVFIGWSAEEDRVGSTRASSGACESGLLGERAGQGA